MPFFNTKELGKGTGLGLATVYSIVTQHAGFIHVYSEPLQGSLFRVYLPITEGAGGVSPEKPAMPLIANLGGSETIPFAEDLESIREMACQALSGLGYHALAAVDGEDALRLCERKPLQSPSWMYSCQNLADRLRRLERFKSLPLGYISGYSPQCDNAALAASHAHYLQKPYSPSTLSQLVREILDQAKVSGTH